MPPLTTADPEEVRKRLVTLAKLVGNTPLVALHCRFRGVESTVYAKLETANLTASIKDRMALHILASAHESGEIAPGDIIAEATSGNTGISFAALGSALGHPVRIFMPNWMSSERVAIIQSLGASVIPVSAEQGGFVGSIRMADEFAATEPRVFRPHQFSNEANIEAHYRTTGPELLEQMQALAVQPAAFVAGVGTGGTVMGVGRYLRENCSAISIHPLEPANSPTLRTGCKVGKHRIQGISDEFIPQVIDLDWLDALVDVWDGDAILMAQKLAGQFGLAVGISSGANLLGALSLAHELGEGACVATILPDCNKKYLSTDLCSDEEPKDGYLTPEVTLLGFEVVPATVGPAVQPERT